MHSPRFSALFVRRSGASRLSLASLLALLSAPSRGLAQAEAEKPAPNVLLLVDTSGSMEFKPNGLLPTCTPGVAGGLEKSRWIDLVEVLTGSFDGYSCWAQDRSSTDFRNEFSLDGNTPYDFGYVNPYHRALSNSCLYGPGVLPPAASPYSWPDRAVNTFELVGGAVLRPAPGALASHPGCAAFSQASDGLLDVYKDMVRFGLMTFDARVGGGTGLSGATADYPGGFDGNWSYPIGSMVTGHPGNCDFDMPQEVGARNGAAPPWEGRMIAFGPPDLADHTQRNRWIQEVLLSTRPYGATPIAGQLDDARHFLWNDSTTDPLDSSKQFGPTNDPNWRAQNCRKSILVLLTDGEPNLDLRPFCEAEATATQTAGRCPYQKPEDIVSALRLAPPDPNLSVETYVVAFALGRVTPAGSSEISCAELTDTQCADPLNNVEDEVRSKNIQACCTLNEIAAAGGLDASGAPRKAFFAEDRTQLKAIFTDILDDVVQVATRTMPVFSSPGGDTTSKGYKFFSAFDPQPDPTTPQLWEGILERRRFVCTGTVLTLPAMNPLRGDDFAANINSGAGPERWFYTVIGDDNRNSLRPFVTADNDGIGTETGTQVFAERPSELSALVPPEAMQVTASSCPATATAQACRDLIVKHVVGLTNGSAPNRCPTGGCQLFGGIFHSTPTIVPGRPSELLRDESYTLFGTAMATDARPSTLYTSTVDGFLHAFNLAPFPGSTDAVENAVDERENNELWSFIPPAVLPVLQAQYPNTPAVLLDGVPIIKDVVAFDDEGVLRYERRQSDAQTGSGDWRTVLVQGFGEGQVAGGYFAIDITKPDRDDGPPTFRWQLTRDASGNALFGSGGTPLITTVFLDAATGGPREVPVAVLPGGDATHGSGSAPSIGPIMDTDPPGFTTSRSVRNYVGAEDARSLTIVRLDTGQIIRTFRPGSGAAPFDSDVFTATDIPAPITGQPKAFPEIAGAVADRIFVGDRDGRMWRVDVSSQDASEWRMQVFYDAFEDGTVTESQPVLLPPVLSVNETGDVTVAFATGDQDVTGGDTSENRVISLTENLDDSNEFIAHVNWIHELDPGDRVTGPMVLFNSGLYYAASRPPSSTIAACDVGSSKVFGAHFEDSRDAADAAESGDDPDPTTGPAAAPGGAALVIASKPGLVFGVSLDAEPTCSSEEEVVAGNESFGYGEVRMSTEVNPGRYFLTFEASGNNTDDGSGTASRGVLEVRQQLESPRLPVTFESWAVVYE